MKKIDKLYDNRVVIKPWGYEYVVYRNSNNLSVTLLKINYNKKTSLHCHPQKKSGFILLSGKAKFQLGLRAKNSEIHASPSKRMMARGLFHSIKSISKEGLSALEFETPVNKNDLVRFKDSYGRQKKSYEGKKFTKDINLTSIKFKKPISGKYQAYKFDKTIVSLEVHKNFKNLLRNKKNTIFAILDGALVDQRGKKVLSYGDIVRTSDLKILSTVFNIKKSLSVVKVLQA
ncbi:MAG: Mannose-6-phosphate isomerase [Pelagibacterales bacterium]|nr:Mannose-6-phosphate isomerase [Pelagibacterales bacterium]|tara:strand:+ start:4174 stop:4866 length:693 start_codon:yes stop_codon:yes gene_type:complete